MLWPGRRVTLEAEILALADLIYQLERANLQGNLPMDAFLKVCRPLTARHIFVTPAGRSQPWPRPVCPQGLAAPHVRASAVHRAG